MRALFKKAAKLGCGIELNRRDMACLPEEEEFVLRPFRIAKEEGCKFYLASDSHTVKAFTLARATFESAIEKLGLTESDKFLLSVPFLKKSDPKNL